MKLNKNTQKLEFESDEVVLEIRKGTSSYDPKELPSHLGYGVIPRSDLESYKTQKIYMETEYRIKVKRPLTTEEKKEYNKLPLDVYVKNEDGTRDLVEKPKLD